VVTSILIFFFGYAVGFAGHYFYVKLDRNVCNKEGTPSASHNSRSVEIKCEKCGINLPPLVLGEGEPCPTGYLCRKCMGLS